jgi:hypothetical protein
MRLMAGVACCLLLNVMVLLLPVITTAQSDQEIIQRIEELEQWIRDHPGAFDWNVHNELRHLYSIKNPPDLRKSMEHSNVILQHSVMDEYILNILSGWQIGVDTPAARANLLMYAQPYPDLRFIVAACFLKIGDLYTEEGNLEEARSYYLRVAEDTSPDMAQYRMLAEERLSQKGQPPVITFLGDSLLQHTQGCPFDPAATATDAEDGDLTDAIIVTGTENLACTRVSQKHHCATNIYIPLPASLLYISSASCRESGASPIRSNICSNPSPLLIARIT